MRDLLAIAKFLVNVL